MTKCSTEYHKQEQTHSRERAKEIEREIKGRERERERVEGERYIGERIKERQT